MSDKRELLTEIDEEMLCLDGFDEAIIGFVTIAHKAIALYDYQKIIGVMVERDGMTEEEAMEYHDYNIAGSYVGDMTPAIAYFFE